MDTECNVCGHLRQREMTCGGLGTFVLLRRPSAKVFQKAGSVKLESMGSGYPLKAAT